MSYFIYRVPHQFECHSNSTITSTNWTIVGSNMATFSGILELKRDVLPRLKALNTQTKVTIAKVLYCPQHLDLGYLNTLHLINRQIRRMNKEASGTKSPQPWRVLNRIKRTPCRRRSDTVIILPGSFSKDGYHISDEKTIEYEAELVAFMETMLNDTQQ